MKLSKLKTILLLAPMPPPIGGMATWTKTLLTANLPSDYALVLINTKLRQVTVFGKFGRFYSQICRLIVVLWILFENLLRKKPNLIHLSVTTSLASFLFALICIVIAHFFRIPGLLQFHSSLTKFFAVNYHKSRFKYYVFIKLLAKADGVLVLSKEDYVLLSSFDKVAPKVMQIPNFIDDNIFLKQVVFDAKSTEKIQALYVGNVSIEKGCREILAIAKNFPEVNFVLVGNIKPNMESVLNALPKNVILKRELPAAEVINEMCTSDFLLLLSYAEGFPYAVLEAMSLGLPVIATKVGAIPEMIDEGYGGFLINLGDVVALTAAIKSFVDNPTQKITMGQYNRTKSLNNYACSKVIWDLINCYEKILKV